MAHQATILVLGPEAVGGPPLLRVLRGSGCKVDTVFSQTQAYARCLQGAPDLVLCDPHAPNAEGLVLAQQLHKREATSVIPIVFVTDHPEEQTLKELEPFGGGYYVLKPVSYEQLCQDLQMLIVRLKKPGSHVAEPYRVLRQYKVGQEGQGGEFRPGAARAVENSPVRLPPGQQGVSRQHIEALLDSKEHPGANMYEAFESGAAQDSAAARPAGPADTPQDGEDAAPPAAPIDAGAVRLTSYVQQPPDSTPVKDTPSPSARRSETARVGQSTEIRDLRRLVENLTADCLRIREVLDRMERGESPED